MAQTVAEQLVEVLRQVGVERIYGLVGDSLNPLADAGVLALAGKVHSPIGHALGGKEVIQYDNPFDVGMSGLLGYGARYEATNEADLLVLLGTDFPYDAFPPQTRTVQVEWRLRPECRPEG